MNIQKHIKTIKLLEIWVCSASVLIGGGIGAACYFVLGAISGGLGGLLVGMVWCHFMRKAFARVSTAFGSLFIAGVALGAAAGAVDGVFMHFTSLALYYSRFNSDLPMSFMIMIGLLTGAIAGAINGGFWGLFYSTIVYRAGRNKTLETSGVEGYNAVQKAQREKCRY